MFCWPPNSSNYLPPNFTESFNNILCNAVNENKEIIVLEDFNVNYLKSKSAMRIDNESAMLIDVIATNNHSNIESTKVLTTGL